jgi:glycosyltransferase involved in cell wall biosynthesis
LLFPASWDVTHALENHVVKVSAVITSWNREKELVRAVESALAQTLADVEMIVVDNASDFDIAETLRPYGERVRVIRNDQNHRVAKARNIGVKAATGAYVAFLDDDDIWKPEKLQNQLATIGEAVVCLCGMDFIPGGGSNVQPITEVRAAMLMRGNPICGPSGFFCRRDLFDRIQFDESLRYAEDWDFLIRALRHGKIAYCPESLLDYTVTTAGAAMTTEARRLGWSDMQHLFDATEKHRKFLGGYFYRRRLAKLSLAHLASRPDRLAFIGHSVRKAGVLATAVVLSETIGRKLKAGLVRRRAI